MTPRRALTVAVIGCVAAGLLLVVAAGRPWQVLHLGGPLPQRHGVSGRAHTPVPSAVGWLGAAAGLALLAVRRWGRVLIGLLLVVSGAAAAVESVRYARRGVGEFAWTSYGPVTSVTLTRTVWPWVAVAAAVVLAVVGLWVVLRGGRWPGMGERYDAPAEPRRPADPAAAAWDALDRGDDPTA